LETVRVVTLKFSAAAREHILQIHTYIAERNPSAASRVVERIRAAAELLHQFPRIGREGRAGGTREWVVRGLPYIIVYEVGLPAADDVLVLAVFHGARRQ
jgi:toxin ParE1/3/4